VELPPAVRGVEVMGRDEDLEAIPLRRLENPLHVLDGLVLSHALTDQWPRDALLAQHVVLGVNEDDRGVDAIEAGDAFGLWHEAPRDPVFRRPATAQYLV